MGNFHQPRSGPSAQEAWTITPASTASRPPRAQAPASRSSITPSPPPSWSPSPARSRTSTPAAATWWASGPPVPRVHHPAPRLRRIQKRPPARRGRPVGPVRRPASQVRQRLPHRRGRPQPGWLHRAGLQRRGSRRTGREKGVITLLTPVTCTRIPASGSRPWGIIKNPRRSTLCMKPNRGVRFWSENFKIWIERLYSYNDCGVLILVCSVRDFLPRET